MPAWRVILRREFRDLAGGRAYLVTTLLGVVLILALSFLPAIVQYINTATTRPVRVVSPDPTAYQIIRAYIDSLPPPLRPGMVLEPDTGDPSWSVASQRLDELVRQGRIRGYLWVGAGPEAGVFRYTEKTVDSSELSRVQQLVVPLAVSQRAAAAGISMAQLQELSRPVPVEGRSLVTPRKGAAGVGAGWTPESAGGQILTYVLLLALYMAIVLYGSNVSMSVINEKSSRVVELLVATARPHEIMIGKLLGVGLAGLVQYTIWLLAGVAALALAPLAGRFLPMETVSAVVKSVPVASLVYLALFFALGYLLYAGLYAGLTATAARLEEVNQATLPVTMLLAVGVSIAFMAWGVPDSPVAVAASFFPFFTPMVMFARIALSSVPPWQIAVGVVLCLFTAWGALVLSGRLYRNNVLRFRRVGLLAGLRASPRR